MDLFNLITEFYDKYEFIDGKHEDLTDADLYKILVKPHVILIQVNAETYTLDSDNEEYSVIVRGFDTEEEADDYGGCIHCGGLYNVFAYYKHGEDCTPDSMVPF